MEESSNERPEETLKVQAHDEEKEAVLDDSPVSKPDEFVRDIITDRNPKSANETPDEEDSSSSTSRLDKEAEPDERNPPVENSETFEEEKVVSDSVVESVEHKPGVSLTKEFSQEKSGDSDIAEINAKETEENISPSLDETNADSPMLKNSLKKETEQQSSAETTGDSARLTDEELKAIDKEATLPGLDGTDGSMAAADVVAGGIEGTIISCLAGNGVPAAAVAQGITETKIPASDHDAGGSSGSPELSSKENVEDSLQAENVPIVETGDAGELVSELQINERTGNQASNLTHLSYLRIIVPRNLLLGGVAVDFLKFCVALTDELRTTSFPSSSKSKVLRRLVNASYLGFIFSEPEYDSKKVKQNFNFLVGFIDCYDVFSAFFAK